MFVSVWPYESGESFIGHFIKSSAGQGVVPVCTDVLRIDHYGVCLECRGGIVAI